MAKKFLTLRPLQSNSGLRVAYKKQLVSGLEKIWDDLVPEILSEYDRLYPRIAHDAAWRSPAEVIFSLIEEKRQKWRRRSANTARDAARGFVLKNWRNIRKMRENAIQNAGIQGFKFKRIQGKKEENSPPKSDSGEIASKNINMFVNETAYKPAQNALEAIMYDNVNLITVLYGYSFDSLAQVVQNAVTNGLDRRELVRDLKHQFKIMEDRAQRIARDQTNKAVQAFCRVTDDELGITEGVWVHVPGRKQSRETHVKMDGKKFNINEGLFDKQVLRKVKPGELILCCCTYAPVIPGSWNAFENEK